MIYDGLKNLHTHHSFIYCMKGRNRMLLIGISRSLNTMCKGKDFT
jgi:hypothetical protein